MDLSSSPTSWNPKLSHSQDLEATGGELDEFETSEMKPPSKVPTRKRIRSGDNHTGLTQDLTDMLRLRKRSCPNLLQPGGLVSLDTAGSRRRSQGNLDNPVQEFSLHHPETADPREEYYSALRDNSTSEPGDTMKESSPTRPSEPGGGRESPGGGTESPGSASARDQAMSSSSEGSGQEGSEQVTCSTNCCSKILSSTNCYSVLKRTFLHKLLFSP